MISNNKTKILFLTSILLLSSAISLNGCTSGDPILVKPDDTSDVTGVVTEIIEITEAPVTEPEEVKPDINTVRVRPEQTEDAKYSSLSDFENCLKVENGYYKLDFLEDKEFESQINEDIKAAEDKLKANYNDDYAAQASRSHSKAVIDSNGIMADVIIRNGFLSVLLEYGYYEPYGTEMTGGYSTLLKDKKTIYFDHAVTLNYELSTKNKVNSLSELFYADADVNSSLTSAIYSEYNNSPSVLPDGEPELFTLDYVLIPCEDGSLAAVRYNSDDLNLSLCGDMISSHYRPMNGISPLASDVIYDMYSQTSLETCPNCGGQYQHIRFDTSRFYSRDELNAMNAELEILYDHGFLGRENHECFTLRSTGTVRQYNPEANKRKNHINLWSCADKDNKLYFYDQTSGYIWITIESIIGNNWRGYAESEDPEAPDISTFEPDTFMSLSYDPASETVNAVICGYSPTYQRGMNVVVKVPASEANANYLVS